MNKTISVLLCLSFFLIAVLGPKDEQGTATICANIWLAIWVILDNYKIKPKSNE